MISRAKGIDSVGEIGGRVCGAAGGGREETAGGLGFALSSFCFGGGGGLRLHTGLHAMIR